MDQRLSFSMANMSQMGCRKENVGFPLDCHIHVPVLSIAEFQLYILLSMQKNPRQFAKLL